MTDRSTFDAFERRIADELGRYVAPATDPKPASEIAKAAMRPRGLLTRARNASRRRRFLVLALAAAFLVPATYFGAASVLPPAPTVVPPSPPAEALPTAVPVTTGASRYISIFVRRDDGSHPGTAIFAVRQDGTETLLRSVPDSILSGPSKVSDWGTVSESGWLALAVELNGGPWPMILVDLRDPKAQPWMVEEANTGGIGPRWGPTGLIAASLGSTGLMVVDPDARTTRLVSVRGLVGGGPSIVWSGDGAGIVSSAGDGTFDVAPIDGSAIRPGVAQVFDPRGTYGPGLSSLQICSPGESSTSPSWPSRTGCTPSDDGHVERAELDGSVRTIWQQNGVDRALAAGFGRRLDEYWLSVDHDGGRQVAFVHVHNGRADTVATVNRASDWNYVGPPVETPDQSALVAFLDLGAKPGAVLVPLDGSPPTFHSGTFAGFVDSGESPVFAGGTYGSPPATMPPAGVPYRIPSVDELIAAELALNPGRVVLGKATHEAVDGDVAIKTDIVQRDQPGPGDAYLDCFGPSSVTVTSGASSVTSPCLRAGSYAFTIDPTAPVTVKASGDTSWRVVLYSTP